MNKLERKPAVGELRAFSQKQLQLMTWWCKESPDRNRDGIICDGAVRSGKTMCMSLSFVLWSMEEFEGQNFALCGKTITSLRRNVVEPLVAALTLSGFCCKGKISKNYLDIRYGKKTNRYYLFSGRDEGAAALIQGITLAGALFDEAALMARSFVEQAVARCSIAGSKFWFNCNPENPGHWLYTQWICKREEKNLCYLHFTMKDNPSLLPQVRRRYEKLYSGSFYERFVLGRWVCPQGAVYPMFSREKHVTQDIPEGGKHWISCDYGTVNPCSMGLWTEKSGVWYRVKEYYHDSRRVGNVLTDEEYYLALEELAGGRRIEAVVADPSAASFLTCIRRHGKFNAIPAKNEVLDGIRRVSDFLREGRLKFSPSCVDSLREFERYRWDEKVDREKPVKENDHAMDDIRYMVMTICARETGGSFCAVSLERRK